MKQTRQAVCAVKQSRFLDVYATDKLFLFTKQASQTRGQWYSDTSSFSIPWFVTCADPVIVKVSGKHSILLIKSFIWALKKKVGQNSKSLKLP